MKTKAKAWAAKILKPTANTLMSGDNRFIGPAIVARYSALESCFVAKVCFIYRSALQQKSPRQKFDFLDRPRALDREIDRQKLDRRGEGYECPISRCDFYKGQIFAPYIFKQAEYFLQSRDM